MGGIFSAIQLIMRLWDLIENLIKKAKEKDSENWLKLSEETVRAYAALATSKTPEEKDAAKKRVGGNWLKL